VIASVTINYLIEIDDDELRRIVARADRVFQWNVGEAGYAGGVATPALQKNIRANHPIRALRVPN
jgi:hypothetical protein